MDYDNPISLGRNNPFFNRNNQGFFIVQLNEPFVVDVSDIYGA